LQFVIKLTRCSGRYPQQGFPSARSGTVVCSSVYDWISQ
jgi:hypothetical protein